MTHYRGKTRPSISDMDERARSIFKQITQLYLTTGEPVGSRTLSRQKNLNLSAASIRNVMADLTELGLLEAPHISAGRQPTLTGLRLFVDGLMEVDSLTKSQRNQIGKKLRLGDGDSETAKLEAVSQILSGIAGGAGLVLAPKRNEQSLLHIEFVPLNKGQSIIVIVDETGEIQNRVLNHDRPFTPAQLSRISNFLNSRVAGKTLAELAFALGKEITSQEKDLDDAASQLVKAGVAAWSGGAKRLEDRQLIIRGRAKLLENLDELEKVEHVKTLLEELDEKKQLAQLLRQTQEANGVKIFIGAESPFFTHSAASVIVAPYQNEEKHIIGALGVVGPTRINYARVIPLVNYTAELLSQSFEK